MAFDLSQGQTDQSFDLNMGRPEVQRTEGGVNEKVNQAKFADPEMDTTVLQAQYQNGEDQSVDSLVGMKRQADAMKAQQAVVDELVKSGGDLSGYLDGVQKVNEDYSKNAVVKEYARRFANQVGTEAYQLKEADTVDPEITYRALDVIDEWTAKASIVRDVVDQTVAKYNDKSLLGKVGSVVGTMIPFADWYARNDAVAEVQGILPGNNLKEQLQYLWSLPVDEIGPTLQKAIDEASTFSDLGGMLFAQAFQRYSSSDQFMDNAFGVMDVASVVPVTKLVKAGKAAGVLTRDTMKSVIRNGAKPAEILNDLGHTAEAAAETAVRTKVLETGIKTANEVADHLPTLLNPDKEILGARNVSNATRRYLYEGATKRASVVEAALRHGINDVNMLTDSERAVLYRSVIEEIQKTHPHIKNSIVDAKTVVTPADKSAINVDSVTFRFGKTNGEGFKTEQSAKTWASRNLGITDTEVVQEGDRFWLETTKPIPASDNLWDLKLDTTHQSPDLGFLGQALYSDSYKLSPEQIADRRGVSDNVEFLSHLTKELGKPLTSLRKGDMQDFMDTFQSISDSLLKDKGKKSWPDVDGFIDAFQNTHNRMPSEKQIDAYTAARQINDLDYVARDLSLLKKKMRLGIQRFEIPGAKPFEGIPRKEIPWGSGDYFSVRAVDKDGLTLKRATNATKTDSEARKFMDQKLDEGWTLIQSAEGSLLHGPKGKEARSTFVLVQAPKRRNVLLGESVNYNPGGHLINKYPYYAKVPKVRTATNGSLQYMGDTTFFNFRTEKEGREITKRLNEANDLRKAGRQAEFEKYVTDYFPELTPEDFKNVDHGFYFTKSGLSTSKSGFQPDNMVNLEDNVFNVTGQLSGRFLGERDSTNVKALVQEGDGVIRAKAARVLNPMEALSTGVRDALDRRLMGDYIDKSANTFIREFGDLLSENNKNAFRRNPVPYLNNPEFLPGMPPEAVKKAKEVAASINYFIGTPTEGTKAVMRRKQKIVEWAMGKFGEDSKTFKVIDEHLLHTVADPASFFRGVAFHTKMGLFNVKQLALQSQIWTNIASIGGLRDTALRSTPAYFYTKALGMTAKPQMLDDAAKRMAKFGWKESDFKEAYRALNESGWNIVGSTNAWRDLYDGVDVIQGKWGKVLDYGTAPFRAGEEYGRTVAWYTAYQNWRKANPSAVLDRNAIRTIRVRASDFTANMTRDMNAAWQRGFMAVPTQFWGFQARIFEQMISPASRLTLKERVRLFSGISAMYGVPVGIGASVAVWPVNEEIQKYLMQEGYDKTIESNPVLEAIRDGIQSVGLEMLTGMDFDTGPYGPAGLPAIKQMLNGDSSWYEVFGGASAGIVADMMGPLAKGAWDMVFGEGQDSAFQVDAQTMAGFLDKTQVSTLKNSVKLWKALNTGKWITGNESVVGDVSMTEAVIASLSGLDLESHSDTYLRFEMSKEVKDEITKARKDMRAEYQRARRAMEAGEMESYAYHTKRAKAIGIQNGLTETDKQRAFMDGFYPQTLEEASQKSLEDYVLKHYERKKGVQ